MTVFEAYITNLGKYAEGQLVGETLKFPATTEEVQSLLKNIGGIVLIPKGKGCNAAR